MHFTRAISTILAARIARAFSFSAETTGLEYENLTKPIPLTQDLGASQSTNINANNSWWSSSYVHASNSHDYLILSHIGLGRGSNPAMFYRASILDINETTNYWRIARVIDPSSGAVQPHEGTLNLTLDKYGFISVDKTKPLGAMRTWSTSNMVWFNLTFELSAPILLNGGIGTFQWGSEISYEWSMPAGLTYGSFIANGDWLTVDTAHSMTWYDRQIAWPHGPMDGPPRANWTWFEVHLNEQKMSIWIWDTQDHRRFQFATVREEPGVHQVLAVTDFIPSMRQWTSPISNATYSLDWVVSLGDETTLQLSSIRADQELCDPRGRIPTYGGYVNVTGMRDGRPLSGYGVVEIVPFSPH